jgi:hypothetical protein
VWAAAAVLAAGGGGGSAGAATWNGGAGNWNAPGNWTGSVPDAGGEFALIDGGNAGTSTVTLNISPTIASLTIDAGDALLIENGRTLTLSGGATVNGTITLLGGSSTTGLTFTGAQTLAGSGQVLFGGPVFTPNNAVGGSGPLTIGAGMTVRTDTQGGTITAATLTNQGLIHAQTSGRVLTVAGGAFVNQGTMRVTQGILAVNATSWTNAGTINLTNGALLIGGTVSTAGLNLPGIVRTGGSLLVRGTLDNTGAVLPLTPATGSFILSGGTLRGGTATGSGAALWFVGESDTGTLDNVHLQTPLRVNNGGTLTVVNGLRIGAGFNVAVDGSGRATSIVFDGAQTLSGDGQLRFEGNATSSLNGTGPLTIGPGIDVFNTASNKGVTVGVAALTNHGLMIAQNEGATMAVNTPAFTNHGTLRAHFGGTLAITAGVSGTGAVVAGPSGTVRAAFLRQGSLSIVATEPGVPEVMPARVQIHAKAQGGQTSVLKSLSFEPDGTGKPVGTLDLADTALVIDYTGASPMAAVRGALLSGRAGGTWAGPGITSSAAAASAGTRTLGYAEAADALGEAGGPFAGQAADGTSVLVRYTLFGDATLDGTVDFNDLVKLAQNYETTVSAVTDAWWGRGDFTYDGVVDFNDLVKLAQNYETSLPAAGAVPAALRGDWAVALASVPEPAGVGMILLGAGTIGLRRRR